MFFRDAVVSGAPVYTPALVCSLAVSLAVTVWAGIAPRYLIDWVRALMGS
jgi:hypothetical protein